MLHSILIYQNGQQLERVIRMVVAVAPLIHLNLMCSNFEMTNSRWPQPNLQMNATSRQQGARIILAFYILITKFHCHQFGLMLVFPFSHSFPYIFLLYSGVPFFPSIFFFTLHFSSHTE